MRIQPTPLPRTHAPRTSAEAFPRSCDYACAVHRTRSLWRGLSVDEWVALASMACLLVAAPFIWPEVWAWLTH